MLLSQQSYEQWGLGFGVEEEPLAREQLLARFPREFWNSVCQWESEFLRRKATLAPQMTSGKLPTILIPVWLLVPSSSDLPTIPVVVNGHEFILIFQGKQKYQSSNETPNPVIISDRMKGMASNRKGTRLDGTRGRNYLSWGWWGPSKGFPEKFWMSHFPGDCRAVGSE